MTGRAGTALLGRAADRIGLTDGLSQAVGGCRSCTDHDPGKVARDLVLMLADGGDALRHRKVLDGQLECVRRGRVGGDGQPHDRRVGLRAGVGWGGESHR